MISQRVLPEDFWVKVPASHDNGDVVGQFVTDPDKPLLHRLILSGVSTRKRNTRIDAQNRVAGSSISCSVARGWWATAVTGRSRLGNGFHQGVGPRPDLSTRIVPRQRVRIVRTMPLGDEGEAKLSHGLVRPTCRFPDEQVLDLWHEVTAGPSGADSS